MFAPGIPGRQVVADCRLPYNTGMSFPRLLLLGKPKFEYQDRPVELSSAKAVALLAFLAAARESQPRERLIGFLWAESTEEAARKNLRNTLWSLRKALGDDVVSADDDQLALGEAVWTDVREFERLGESDPEAAVALYRGPFLDGLSVSDAPDYEIWLTGERERLAESCSRALMVLVGKHRDAGNWRRVVEVAQRALAFDNLQEPMHRALMEAHARLGERAEALRGYDTLQATLDRELGVQPLPETVALRTAIVNGQLGPGRDSASEPRPARRPAARGAKPRSPFVGRRAEFLALDSEIKIAAAGQARVVLMNGEVGIGKSRLWREWSATLAPSATVLEARCLDSTQALPFAPVAEMLSQPAVAHKLFTPSSPVSPIWLEQVARLVPTIRSTLPHLPAPLVLPPEEERRRLFEAFTQCLLALGGKPLVLFVDDVHWADRATLDWLDFLVHRLLTQPLLLVLAYRPEDASSPLAHLIASWGREGLARRLPLARLTDAEAAALLSSLGGDPGLAQRIQAQSAGNPYFLIEMYRAMPEDIPPVLADLIRARLDRLDDASRQVLQAASVLGREFDFALLRRASGRSEEETLGALDTLLGANVLVERAERYDFAHPLVAAVVQKGMSAARRAFVHRRAAQALQVLEANRLAPIAGQLADHYAQAGDPARAAHYNQMAAERAVALAAPEEAVNFYRQAIAAEPTPARQMGLGRVLLQTVQTDEARSVFETALGEYQAAGDRRGAARAALSIAESFFPSGRFDAGREWLVKALAFAESEQDPESHALAHLALASGQQGGEAEFVEAERNLDQATVHAVENHLPDIAGRARFVMGNLLAERGDLPRAIKAYTEAIEYSRAAGNDFQQALGHNNLAYHALLAGDFATAHQQVEAGLALAEARALRLVLQNLYSTRSEIALAEHEWSQAEEWSNRALAEAAKNHNLRETAGDHANLARAAWGRGDLDSALVLLEGARTEAATLADRHLRIKIDLWLAELLLERGECAAADEALARADKLLEGGGRRQLAEWADRLRNRIAALRAG